MKKLELHVEPRKLVGRKVKQLRATKILPANLYGKSIKSQTIQIKVEEFQKTYKEAGETGIIELILDGKSVPTMITQVQVHPVSRALLHVDFHQVNLKEKIRAHIPIELAGMAPAVEQKIGVMLTLLDEVEVEAYPGDLIDKIEADITHLKEIGQAIIAGQLNLPKEIALITEPEAEIVKIDKLVVEEEPAPVATVEGEASVVEAPVPVISEPTNEESK